MPTRAVCACKAEDEDSACYGDPSHKHKGAHYCLFHWPSVRKADEFKEALRERLAAGVYDFRGVWFPEPLHFRHGGDFETTFETAADFSHATFNGGVHFVKVEFKAEAKFEQAVFRVMATFNTSVFKRMPDFREAKFEADAVFDGVRFEDGANFLSAAFGRDAFFGNAYFKALVARFEMTRFEQGAHFESTTFGSNANFGEAVFGGEAHFVKTTFSGRAIFNKATFRDYVRFEGTEAHEMFGPVTQAPKTLNVRPSLELRWAKFESPRRVFFDSLTLRPHWFVRVNARDLNFSNVKWDWRGARAEIKRLKEAQVATSREALEVTCRQLSDNANDSHLYEDASRLRFMAMEARRLEKWDGFVPLRLIWWYWLASGYGERVWPAAAWLACIWLLSGALYFGMDFPHWQRAAAENHAAENQATAARRVGALEAGAQALIYSAAVMTLQRPEPRPTSTAAQGLVMFETVLGPIQAALLALAIRRKFMR